MFEDIVGLGEVGGGDQRGALIKLKPRIMGLDPFHIEIIKLKVLRGIYYLSKYERYYEKMGDYYARFHQDPRRPEWVPVVGGR